MCGFCNVCVSVGFVMCGGNAIHNVLHNNALHKPSHNVQNKY